MILGKTRGERSRTAATVVFLVLTAAYLTVCLVAEDRQETGYRSSLVKFAELASVYANQQGFELEDAGWRRRPYWREGSFSPTLVKGSEELYLLRGVVLCRWFGARLHRVEIEFPPFGEGKGVEITRDFLAQEARPPRAYLEGEEGFPGADELRREVEVHRNPDLQKKRWIEDVKSRASTARREESRKHGRLVTALMSATGIRETYSLCQLAMGIAVVLSAVVVPVLLVFWWRCLRRDPPLALSRRIHYLGWGGAVLVAMGLLCWRLEAFATYQPLPGSGGLELGALGRFLLVSGFALHLWLVCEAGGTFTRMPADGPARPMDGWRHGRLGTGGAFVLAAGYLLILVGTLLHDTAGPGAGDPTVLCMWGGMALAIAGGILLVTSIARGWRDLRRPIGRGEPPMARFLVVAIPLLVTLPALVCLVILAEVR